MAATPNYHDEIWSQVPQDGERRPRAVHAAFCKELVQAGDRVLDLGCGEGLMLDAIAAAGGTPVGADPSAIALERARCRGDFDLELIEGSDLPFPDDDFDGVWCSEVLSHALDVGALLRGAARVLRPAGWLGVTVPRHGRFRDAWATLIRFNAEHDPHRTEIRRFSPQTLAGTLSDAGFEAVRIRTATSPETGRTILAAAARGVR